MTYLKSALFNELMELLELPEAKVQPGTDVNVSFRTAIALAKEKKLAGKMMKSFRPAASLLADYKQLHVLSVSEYHVLQDFAAWLDAPPKGLANSTTYY